MAQCLAIDNLLSDGVEKRERVYGRFAINKALAQKRYLDLKNDGGATNLDTIIQAQATGDSPVSFQSAGDAAEAKASLDLGTLTTNIDTVIRFPLASSLGNLVSVKLIGGAAAGAGSVIEDSTSGEVVFQLLDGVSTVGDFETLVASCTLVEVQAAGTALNVFAAATDTIQDPENLAGGADACYIEESGSLSVLHFTDGVSTVADAEAQILATSTLIEINTSGTGASVLAAADDTIAAMPLRSWKATASAGSGWYAYRESDGTFKVVFNTLYRALRAATAGLIGAPEAHPGKAKMSPTGYTATTKTATILVRDLATAPAAYSDAEYDGTVEVCFEAEMVL